MFGLMKPAGCGHSNNRDAALRRRAHYCGTCKSMGKMYGQRSRMLLNNDSVFLAELLTELGGESPVSEWAQPLRSYNCASMPSSNADIPIALAYASSATVLLTEMKVRDSLGEVGSMSAKAAPHIARRMFSLQFETASRWLKEAGLDVDSVAEHGDRQFELEAQTFSGSDSATILHTLSDPSARMTGLVFEAGARFCNLPAEAERAMADLGSAFGELVYHIDALEDDRADARKHAFNALHAAWNTAGSPLTDEQRACATDEVMATCDKVKRCIEALGLSSASVRNYHSRLEHNVSRRIGVQLEAACCSRGASAKVAEKAVNGRRFRNASDAGARFVRDRSQECSSLVNAATAPFVFLVVFMAVLLFPKPALSAQTWGECAGVLLNLMLWGALANEVIKMPGSLVAANTTGQSKLMDAMENGIPSSSSRRGRSTTTTVTRVRRGPSCCDGCFCDCCDACNCACCALDTCDCACCACDAANCACGDCAGCGCDVCSSCG